jgi:hypothetical protein
VAGRYPARMAARAITCLRPGYMRVEWDLPPVPPGVVQIVEGMPDEVPIELIPPDLRSIGSRFHVVFEPWGKVIAVEPDGATA